MDTSFVAALFAALFLAFQLAFQLAFRASFFFSDFEALRPSLTASLLQPFGQTFFFAFLLALLASLVPAFFDAGFPARFPAFFDAGAMPFLVSLAAALLQAVPLALLAAFLAPFGEPGFTRLGGRAIGSVAAARFGCGDDGVQLREGFFFGDVLGFRGGLRRGARSLGVDCLAELCGDGGELAIGFLADPSGKRLEVSSELFVKSHGGPSSKCAGKPQFTHENIGPEAMELSPAGRASTC